MCIIVFLLITTVHVLPHGWIVDVVGDMVAETVTDPFFSLPPYVDSLFAGDVEKKTNVANTLAIPVPRALINTCLGIITLSAQHFHTVLKLSEDALQIIVISTVAETFLSLRIPVWPCSGLTNQILGCVFSKNSFI